MKYHAAFLNRRSLRHFTSAVGPREEKVFRGIEEKTVFSASTSNQSSAIGTRPRFSLGLWSSVAVGSGVGFVWFWNKRRDRILREIEKTAEEAAAAGAAPFYGKRWGQATDSFIEECLDTGDLIFLQGSLKTKRLGTAAALILRRLLTGETVDSVGVVLVLSGRKFVLLLRDRELELVPYSTLLASDCFSVVSVRRLCASAFAKKAVSEAAVRTLQACGRAVPSQLLQAASFQEESREQSDNIQARHPKLSFLLTTWFELLRRLCFQGWGSAHQELPDAVDQFWIRAGVSLLISRLQDIRRGLETPSLLAEEAKRRERGEAFAEDASFEERDFTRAHFFWRISDMLSDLRNALKTEALHVEEKVKMRRNRLGLLHGDVFVAPQLAVEIYQLAGLLPFDVSASRCTVGDLFALKRLLPLEEEKNGQGLFFQEGAKSGLPPENALGALMFVRNDAAEEESLFFSGMVHLERKNNNRRSQ